MHRKNLNEIDLSFREYTPGIFIVDKPKGISSFDVIRIFQRKLATRKIGHAGTLDPNATGLLIVAVSPATKQLTAFSKLPKTYSAEILLGVKTDTGDTTGTFIEVQTVPSLSDSTIKDNLHMLEGDLLLPVPKYSAVKHAGVSLYKYARQGKELVPKERIMHVAHAHLRNRTDNILTIEWSVGSGTYIRSLAEALGEKLGTVATLQNLRRITIGKFTLE